MEWQPADDDFGTGSPARPGTKTVVICDDFTAVARAVRAVTTLSSQWEFRLDPAVWRFDQLNTASSQRRATDDLADADFVIISFNRPDVIPEPVEQWLEMCLSAKHARSTTWLTHAGRSARWTITFVDAHGTLTPRPEIPALVASRRPVKSRRRSVTYRR